MEQVGTAMTSDSRIPLDAYLSSVMDQMAAARQWSRSNTESAHYRRVLGELIEERVAGRQISEEELGVRLALLPSEWRSGLRRRLSAKTERSAPNESAKSECAYTLGMAGAESIANSPSREAMQYVLGLRLTGVGWFAFTNYLREHVKHDPELQAAWCELLTPLASDVEAYVRTHDRDLEIARAAAGERDTASVSDAFSPRGDWFPYDHQQLEGLAVLREIDLPCWIRALEVLPTLGMIRDELSTGRLRDDFDSLLDALREATAIGATKKPAVVAPMLIHSVLEHLMAIDRHLSTQEDRATHEAFRESELPSKLRQLTVAILERSDAEVLLPRTASCAARTLLLGSLSQPREEQDAILSAWLLSIGQVPREGGWKLEDFCSRDVLGPAPTPGAREGELRFLLAGLQVLSSAGRPLGGGFALFAELLVGRDNELSLLGGPYRKPSAAGWAEELCARALLAEKDPAEAVRVLWQRLASQRQLEHSIERRRGDHDPMEASRILVAVALQAVASACEEKSLERSAVLSLFDVAYDAARTIELSTSLDLHGESRRSVVVALVVAAQFMSTGFASPAEHEAWLREKVAGSIGSDVTLSELLSSLHENYGWTVADLLKITDATVDELLVRLEHVQEGLAARRSRVPGLAQLCSALTAERSPGLGMNENAEDTGRGTPS